MVAPAFGFSTGDFIAGIVLVRDLITALQDGAGAELQFKRLITDLTNLERALTEVRFLKVDDCYVSQKIALEQMAIQCQERIEDFLARNAKFNMTLGAQATSSKWSWRANLHKIQWAMCREDAVNKLRAEIAGRTLTINTLLTTIHLSDYRSATALQTESTKSNQIHMKEHRKATDETQSLAKQNYNLLSSQADLLRMISQNIASCSTRQQAEDLQLTMLKVLDTNMKIYKMIADIQTVQFQLPMQVDRQQPVYFEDAHGRIAPFHIEFISSFDAFQAVMEVRFSHVPGLKKVQNVDYTIQDSGSKRKLDLTASWDSIFLPGRKITMSIVFRRPHMSMSSCPGCQTENEILGSNEIQCSNIDCKMWYQRIVEVDTLHKLPIGAQKIRQGKRRRRATPLLPRKRTQQLSIAGSDSSAEEAAEDSEDEDQIQDFRRVYVVHKDAMLLSPLNRQHNSSSIPDLVPPRPEILTGDPSPSSSDKQPIVPQIYTAVYSKSLVYEMEINGVAVMRRRSDSWLNATQILKVAGFLKTQRQKVLKREILIGVHEIIQGGYGKYQGVWISYERGVELCRQYNVEEQLRPLLAYDVGQDMASMAERWVGTLTRAEYMATRRGRSYNWSTMAKSWPGPQNHTAPAIAAGYHSMSHITALPAPTTAKVLNEDSIIKEIGGHLSDTTMRHLLNDEVQLNEGYDLHGLSAT